MAPLTKDPSSSSISNSSTGTRRSTRIIHKPEPTAVPKEIAKKQPVGKKKPIGKSSLSPGSLSKTASSPPKAFNLEKNSPNKTFKLVKNGVIQSGSQPAAARNRAAQSINQPNTSMVKNGLSQSVNQPKDAVTKSLDQQNVRSTDTFSFVNFIPVDAFGNAKNGAMTLQGAPAVAGETRPTFIVQMVSGNSAQDVPSGSSAGTVVLPFTNGPSAPTQCIFRLTAPATTKKMSGVHTQQSFTLNRLPHNGQTKMILVPQVGGATGPFASSSTATVNGVAENKQSTSETAVDKSAPKLTKLPQGFSVTIRSYQKSDFTVSSASPKPVVAEPAQPPVISVSSLQPVVLPHQDVVPLLTTAPPDTDWADLVLAYEASGLNACLSKEKEKKLLKEFENIRCIYEDQQVLWKPLPVAETLMIPGLSPSRIGDLLSLGHFIETLQHVNKTNRSKKRLVDLDFIVSAITMLDGNAGKYLYLLNWLVWAFEERKSTNTFLKIPPEFGISIQSIEVDHVLACESLRQYLVLLVDHRKICRAGSPMAVLLEKLKTTDITSMTITDRADLLAFAHSALLQHTDFFFFCMNRMEVEHLQAIAKRKLATESIGVKMTVLRGMESELRLFEGRAKSTRLEDRERTRLAEELRTFSKDIERMKEEKKELEEEDEKNLKMISMACHSECLGYDRDFNRYWFFPELSDAVFVESGWASSPEMSALKSSAAVQKPKILGNFIFLDRFSELYYLNDNGTHVKCNAKTLAPPLVAENKWAIYKPTAFSTLIDNLNQMGVREGILQAKLKSLLVGKDKAARQPFTERPPPVIAESACEILLELFIKISADLQENQFLGEGLDGDWREKVKGADLAEVKRQIVATYNLIHPQLIRKEIVSPPLQCVSWPESVLESNSVSRLYFLCKVLDLSVLWQRGTNQETCKSCGRSHRRNTFRRCTGCLAVFHETASCMIFDERRCTVCCGTSTEPRSRRIFSYREDAGSSHSNSHLTPEQDSIASSGIKRKPSLERSDYSSKLRKKGPADSASVRPE